MLRLHHKKLPNQQRCSHFIRPEGIKINVVHSLALAPALTLTLTVSLNHLANKPLPMPSILNVFNQHAVVRKYLIRCVTDYKWILNKMTYTVTTTRITVNLASPYSWWYNCHFREMWLIDCSSVHTNYNYKHHLQELHACIYSCTLE